MLYRYNSCIENVFSFFKLVWLTFYYFFLIMEKKHFTSKDLPTNFAHKHGSPNTFWIILISVVFFLFLVFSKWDKIEEFFGLSLEKTEQTADFVLGEEISVEWIITQDWDFVTHTHKLSTLSSGVFGLKSKTINLNQYSGTILVDGFIDTEHQGLFIIDVTQIIDQIDENLVDDNIETWNMVPSGQYLPEMGLYLPPSFFEEYSIIATGKDNLKIKSLNNNQDITIDYFSCKKWNNNTDCNQLSTTFKNSSEKVFTTKHWTVFYKLSEIKSWFFANQELFGYFINDVDEQEIVKLYQYLVVPTNDYIKNIVEPNVSNICKEWNIVMNEVKKTTMFMDQGQIAVTFAWIWEKWTADCTILLDLSLPLFWTVKSFVYEEKTLTWDDQDEIVETPAIDKPTLVDANVAQFPLNLEKPLVFTSSRGHSISFPSPKISYKSDSVSENLDTAGINCYVATKVIEYAKKDLIDSEPSVIVYECKIKENVDLPYQYYAKPVSDGRTFVVSVIDPAWHDFANNIQVTLN